MPIKLTVVLPISRIWSIPKRIATPIIGILKLDSVPASTISETLGTPAIPLLVSISANINKIDLNNTKISIDLKPALTYEELDKRVLSDFKLFSNKEFKNALSDLLPKKLIPVIVRLSGIKEDTKVNVISAENRKNLVHLLKNFDFSVKSLAPIEEAVVTSGGVNVKEINPKTFESKKVQNLYFIGEVVDVDAYTGGFNLQIAWSSAVAAARALSR